MNHKSVIFFCYAFHLVTIITGQVGGLSSKLDFGSSDDTEETTSKNIVQAVVSVRQSSANKQLISSKHDQSPFNFRSVASAADLAAEKAKKDFKSLSLVCVDGACNTTDIKTSKKGDINTDIIVKVSTNVEETEGEQKIKGMEDDADVPVVVGTSRNTDIGRRMDSQGNVFIQPTSSPVFIPYNLNQNVHSKPSSSVDHHQVSVPRLEPNYNNHYFGENPPPMYVWYKRRSDPQAHNPHAFHPESRPHWKTNRPFSDWQRSYTTNSFSTNRRTTPTGWTPSTVCTCTNPGLNWYPSTVDDKLGQI